MGSGLSRFSDASSSRPRRRRSPRRIGDRVKRCLRQAGLAATDIDAVFLTGGSTLLPHVRRHIVREIPAARIIEGDKFGSVGLSLAIDARRRYG